MRGLLTDNHVFALRSLLSVSPATTWATAHHAYYQACGFAVGQGPSYQELMLHDFRGLTPEALSDTLGRWGWQWRYRDDDCQTRQTNTSQASTVWVDKPQAGSPAQANKPLADYVLAWQVTHALAHKMTATCVRLGSRVGSIKDGRLSLDNALGALHWEQLAVAKQHILLERLGAGISGASRRVEAKLNIVAATCRALTGVWVNPGALGILPGTLADHPNDVLMVAAQVLATAHIHAL